MPDNLLRLLILFFVFVSIPQTKTPQDNTSFGCTVIQAKYEINIPKTVENRSFIW